MIRYLLLIIVLLTIGFTSLVSMPGSPYLIGGMTQADISAMFATSITPAGFTFAIWSVIYLSWIITGLTIAGLPLTRLTRRYLPTLSQSLEHPELSSKAVILFSLAIALTAVWLLPWGNLWIGVALVVMFAILVLLAYVFVRTRTAHIVVRSSIELTLGWIIMATALNVTVWMRYMGWSIGGPTDIYYAIGAIGALLLIVAYLQCRYRTYIISVLFLWTLLGVYIAHPVSEQQVMVGISAIVTFVNMIHSYVRRR